LIGTIPEEIGSISTIKSLNFFSNGLNDSLPARLGNLPLTFLDIESNSFSGILFTENFLMLADTLVKLRASRNTFSGTIPNRISDFTLLQEFWIGDNEFNGIIPDSISALVNLDSLILRRNKFEGSIPDSIGLLLSLEQILLDTNMLDGEIPTSLANLKNLQLMTLNNNTLVGEIPPGFKDLINLERFRAFDNKLVGKIPVLEQMTNLSKLINYFEHLFQLIISLTEHFFDSTSFNSAS
jgi:Leucine-rich repeat (LRR) protein